MTETAKKPSSSHGDTPHQKLFRQAVQERPDLRWVFELHPGAAPDINNEIHPLFRRSNFPSASLYEYHGMSLALRLASLWLTVDPLLDWWMHASFDLEIQHPEREEQVLDNAMMYTPAHAAYVKEALANLAEFVVFDFDIYQEFVSCGRSQWHETVREPIEPVHPFFRVTNEAGKRVVVKLHEHFRDYAREAFFNDPLDAQLRYSFFLAAVLTHEVCHTFSMMKRNSTLEPLFHLEAPTTDWGTAWEMKVLGGEINPYHLSQMAPTTTLMAADWVDRGKQCTHGGLASSVVPMNWVAMWFKQRFWTEMQRGVDLREPPCCPLQVWQRTDKDNTLALFINDEAEPVVGSMHRSRGTKRKVSEKDSVDSDCDSAERGRDDGRRHAKRPHADSNDESVSSRTVKIDDS
ncbi:hypothetical protein MPH_05657 [Macrophomina phaseolina MS6]|uniref:Uncharacterized protein n=2 Tax=Macrophomina phaseolina TaxID=35725 RepID=K2SJW6_MACPH|nr:hypothetical protein MPH_05657 [Macrophomina phaseolina MS6]KAH7049165.1 hypothetical protein B0J12DRAFT_96416 [Macrophomina phaseolina]